MQLAKMFVHFIFTEILVQIVKYSSVAMYYSLKKCLWPFCKNLSMYVLLFNGIFSTKGFYDYPLSLWLVLLSKLILAFCMQIFFYEMLCNVQLSETNISSLSSIKKVFWEKCGQLCYVSM